MKKEKDHKKNILLILAYCYGFLSSYCLFRLFVPKGFIIVYISIMFFGGFYVAGGASFIVSSLDDKGKNISRYLKIVLLAAYFVPIALYVTYYIQLSKLQRSSATLDNDDVIRFEYSVDFTVDDQSNPDSKWVVTLSDYKNKTIETNKAFEVNKYDILYGLVNIHCNSHDIYDNEYPAANYNDRTVQRSFTFWVGDDYINGYSQEGEIVIYDQYDNEITVHLSVTANLVCSCWDVLSARSKDSNGLEIFDEIGRACPNLEDYLILNNKGSLISDTVATYVEDDGSTGVIFKGKLYNRDVAISMEPGNLMKYDIIETYTLAGMSNTEAKAYMKKVRKGIIDKYSVQDIEDWLEDGSWRQEIDDIVFLMYFQETDDGYSVVTRVTTNKNQGENIAVDDSVNYQEPAEDIKLFYILNKETGVYHLPGCSIAKSIKEENKKTYMTTREELNADGYTPCSFCINNTVAARSQEEVAKETGTESFDYKKVKLEEVESSAISELGYDMTYSILLIRFKESGALYAYYNVPYYVYVEFMDSSSPGSYFNYNIKSEYTCVKLE